VRPSICLAKGEKKKGISHKYSQIGRYLDIASIYFNPGTFKINLQVIFGRGREVPIPVLGEGGGVVTAGEVIRNATSFGTNTGH